MNGVAIHRIRLQRGSAVTVRIGAQIRPDEVIALRRQPLDPIRVAIARPLRCAPADIDDLLQVRPGSRVVAGERLAGTSTHEVSAPVSGVVLAISHLDGTILLAPLGAEEPVISHVRGKVRAVEDGAVAVEVPAARVRGVGGSGEAVHGELAIGVQNPEDELRAAAIDVGATGRILVGGSRGIRQGRH